MKVFLEKFWLPKWIKIVIFKKIIKLMVLEELFNEYMEVKRALESDVNQQKYQAITSGRASSFRTGNRIIAVLEGKNFRNESPDLTEDETLEFTEDYYKEKILSEKGQAANSKEALQDRLAKLQQEIIALCEFQGSRGLISFEGQQYFIKPNDGELIVEPKS
jgi:acetyl-CoA carboxylase beta subunit